MKQGIMKKVYFSDMGTSAKTATRVKECLLFHVGQVHTHLPHNVEASVADVDLFQSGKWQKTLPEVQASTNCYLDAVHFVAR